MRATLVTEQLRRLRWRSSNSDTHPSVALWTAHNEPADTSIVPATNWRARLRDVAAQQLPTWNKSVLDRWGEACVRAQRPEPNDDCPFRRAPPLPTNSTGPTVISGTGGAQGEARDLDRLARRMPRSVRFVSEFGTESVPTTAPFFGRTVEN